MKGMSILKRQRGRAPVPKLLPGEFFVLEYLRELETFSLHVDDEDYSTYDLGNDTAELQVLFRTLRIEATGEILQPKQIDRMIDISRELGMAHSAGRRTRRGSSAFYRASFSISDRT